MKTPISSRKSSIIDKALFWEGIQQTRWTAVIGLIVCVFLKIFQMQGTYQRNGVYSGFQFGILGVFPNEFSLVVCAMFSVVILFQLFQFMNKSHAGDFYHALPCKRYTIYITYCTVAFTWIIIIIALWSVLTGIEMMNLYEIYLEAGVVKEVSLLKNVFLGFRYAMVRLIPVVGATALALASTGTVFSSLVILLLIWVGPVYMMNLYKGCLEVLIPFLDYYNFADLVLDTPTLTSLDSVLWGWLTIVNFLLGVVYLIMGGVAYCKRKSECVGKSHINRFWKMVLRMMLLLVFCIPADLALARFYWGDVMTTEGCISIICRLLIVLVVWLVFELVLTKKWRNALRSFKQFPVLIAVNAVVILSYILAYNVASKVTSYAEVEAVQVLASYENVFTAGNTYCYDTNINYKCTDEAIKQLVHEKWETEMTEYRSGWMYYNKNYGSQDMTPVIFYTKDKTIVRYLHLDNSAKRKVYNSNIEATKEMYDYDVLPRPEDLVVLDDCSSFGWDFTEDERKALYQCYYEEIQELKLPLITFMGRMHNRSGVFDFMSTYNGQNNLSSLLDMPISIDTPKTLTLLANMGNEKRTDYDFEWFVNYIHNIGEQEKGAKLEVILHVDGEEEIRYTGFDWWSNWESDISNEELAKIQQITTSHKDDGQVSADGNLLMLVYKDIEGVEVTGRWYNITDDEANVLKDMIGDHNYFERYQYHNYY